MRIVRIRYRSATHVLILHACNRYQPTARLRIMHDRPFLQGWEENSRRCLSGHKFGYRIHPCTINRFSKKPNWNPEIIPRSLCCSRTATYMDHFKGKKELSEEEKLEKEGLHLQSVLSLEYPIWILKKTQKRRRRAFVCPSPRTNLQKYICPVISAKRSFL